MGLDQNIYRVNNKRLQEFYNIANDHIIADPRDDIDYAQAAEQTELRRQAADRDDSLDLAHEIWYGRKVNAVHGWVENNFLPDGVDSTNVEYVEIDIERLYTDIDNVLSKHTSPEETMPITEGFFFGDYDYDDEYYWENLIELRDILKEELLHNPPHNNTYFYYSWW